MIPTFIDRQAVKLKIQTALTQNRAVAVIGPRQCGKTTLCKQFVPETSINYFDLEDPSSLKRLDEPVTALSHLKGLVVIDEVQNRPELFPVLRVLIDRKPEAGQYLLLGSASVDLLRQTSESLMYLRDTGLLHYLFGGAELDLLLLHEGRKYGVECKRVDAPRVTPSMLTAITDLELEKLAVVYPGDKAYPLTDQIFVMPLAALATSAAIGIVS